MAKSRIVTRYPRKKPAPAHSGGSRKPGTFYSRKK